MRVKIFMVRACLYTVPAISPDKDVDGPGADALMDSFKIELN